MKTILGILLAVVAVAAMPSCARKQHLSPHHAQSFDEAFAAQRAPARAGPPQGPVLGLDSQEAAIISDTYRGSLAPKGQAAKEEPILIVAPQSRERAAMPPPSVPK